MASVAVDAIDDAILLARALVVDDGTLRPPEEALAAFTGDDSIVDARTLVAAHLARDDLDLRCKKKVQNFFLVNFIVHKTKYFQVDSRGERERGQHP